MSMYAHVHMRDRNNNKEEIIMLRRNRRAQEYLEGERVFEIM